ncbi:putative permease [Desulfocurvibacter africanus PCS]|uniref:Probable membrane transporter protein n=1 Tax=Desulfocurvibacter africanus PCS TaxID=1262666 RepID=M5PP51_DESAF|nr:sulfite exporter TauE/SafE family protein [Desulfocurvibacter africanus]EMG36002.1 putative permease [Desulfocurvibacter africanus PCS]
MRIGKHAFLVAALVLVAAVVLVQPAWADKLADAIQEGITAGKVDPAAEPGYLDIPGAPSVNLILAFVWAIWVGWIFSTVGAFGGVMAGVGHITVYGLGNYGKSFGKGATLNKMVTDSIRVSNQFLVGTSALITSFNYYKMGRLVLPLGVALAIGSILGSWLVPFLTAGKVSFSQYQGWFGVFVLALGVFLFYQTTPAGSASQKKAKVAAKAFQDSVKKQKEGGKVDLAAQGVRVVSFSPSKVVFTFFGVEFSFNPIIPILGGFVIASIAAFLGVGGGFLLVPFLTSVAGLPMYLVAGTSALAVLIGMITSIITYITQGALVDWGLVGIEIIGIVIGSVIGPKTSKYIPDRWLKILFIVLAFYVGLRYIGRGFDIGFLKIIP